MGGFALVNEWMMIIPAYLPGDSKWPLKPSLTHPKNRSHRIARYAAYDCIFKFSFYLQILYFKVRTLIQYGDSENSGTPKSSILIGFPLINHPFWSTTIFGNTYIGVFFPPKNAHWIIYIASQGSKGFHVTEELTTSPPLGERLIRVVCRDDLTYFCFPWIFP